jgi:hypothetical protein
MSLGYCKRILRFLQTLYFQGDFQGFNFNLDTKILHAYRGQLCCVFMLGVLAAPQWLFSENFSNAKHFSNTVHSEVKVAPPIFVRNKFIPIKI